MESLKVKIRASTITGYLILLVLLAILPINDKGSKINQAYLMHLRFDYLFHAILLVPWMSFSLTGSVKKGMVNVKNKFTWFLIGLCFSTFIEGIQFFIPYRAFNLNDLIANISGLIFGWLCLAIFEFLYTAKKNRRAI